MTHERPEVDKSHDWYLPDGALNRRCKKCGAYAHLGSGFSPCPVVKCEHKNVECGLCIGFIKDIGRWMADIKINCIDCKKSFKFFGVPIGMDYNKPTMSFDGKEIRIPIMPEDEEVPSVEGVKGYTITKVQ